MAQEDYEMNVAIVTDSNSGIFEEEGKILGVHVIPMPVILEGKTYYEGIDLTHEEFYFLGKSTLCHLVFHNIIPTFPKTLMSNSMQLSL